MDEWGTPKARRVDVKGSRVPFVATHVFITSNFSPTEWWPNLEDGPVRRRITQEVELRHGTECRNRECVLCGRNVGGQ